MLEAPSSGKEFASFCSDYHDRQAKPCVDVIADALTLGMLRNTYLDICSQSEAYGIPGDSNS